ncbi:unnamed protein product [Rangifer tarandus platyrhynchus]|uniref:Uncharacterized protein n=2 Tax=Rangifer tarandus platyrhynchus TaxID=3082113 RepID=A0AC59YU92_RANTA|nr:unnamed protein product [Rangifer tarandus platyrhynchus]
MAPGIVLKALSALGKCSSSVSKIPSSTLSPHLNCSSSLCIKPACHGQRQECTEQLVQWKQNISHMFHHSVMSDSATPWTVANQAPLFMEFSRQEYWSGLPFPSPGDLPDPGIEPASHALAGRFLAPEPPGKLMSHTR